MTIGDPSVFAIESGITRAYQRPGQRALGFFILHINGRRYGVRSPDATLLACSFDEVRERIARRGAHTAPFANEQDAGLIADAVRSAIYSPNQNRELFFGMSASILGELVASNRLMWAPDGDEAFDDGSYVFHFDFEDRVRLIAFKSNEGNSHDPETLSDRWLDAVSFYNTLQQWEEAFESEWATAAKADAHSTAAEVEIPPPKPSQ